MSSTAPVSNSNTTDLDACDASRIAEAPGAAEETPKKNAQPVPLTWALLKSAFFESLKLIGKIKQIGNFTTAIKFFLEAQHIKEESLVGDELGDEFEAKIKIYIEFEIKRGAEDYTYKPRVSKIRTVKQFAYQNFAPVLALQTLPKSFGRRLRSLIVAAEHTVASFWRTLPAGLVPFSTFRHWCSEQYLPGKKHRSVIEVLEEALDVSAGTLRFPLYLRRAWDRKVRSGDYSNKIRAAKLKPYFKQIGSVLDEIEGLTLHKTFDNSSDEEDSDEDGDYEWLWTLTEGGELPSSDIFKKFMSSFMGFCALSSDSSDPYLKGKGIKEEDLSLALLADRGLWKAYIQFMRLRSGLRVRQADTATLEKLPAHMLSADKKWEFYNIGGKYNGGTLWFLRLVSSLLRPGTGYLYLHPEYAEKLGPRMAAATWQEQCVKTRNAVKKRYKKILKMKKGGNRNYYDFGRDPGENIKWILDQKRPLTVLQGMVKAMLEDLLPEYAPALERARQYRDVILVTLLCANPLRVHMFSIMEFDKHLEHRVDGSWWLKFKQGAFKNRKSLKSDYEVRVAEELWPLLDRYKEEFHPSLVGSSHSKYVFPVSFNARGKRAGARMTEDGLSKIVEMMTELYIQNSEGFRAHAFRHIIATDIIKKDPRLGFFIAAKALHDKLETVEEQYVHLKTSEFFEPVNAHFTEMWGAVFGRERGIEKFASAT
jgi:integrase